MKRIIRVTEVEPVESMCITVDSDTKLFRAGGVKNSSTNSARDDNTVNTTTPLNDSKRPVHSDNVYNQFDVTTNDTIVADRVKATMGLEDTIGGHIVSSTESYDSNEVEVVSGNKFSTGGAFVSHNSVLQRAIIFACILRPESWAFVGVDLKKVELTPYVIYKNVVMGVATELENALEVLRFAQQTMMKRYTMMTELGVKNFLELPEKGQALMVMVDEYGEAASPSGSKTDEGKAADAMKGEIQMLVGSIARLGRAAGVHLVIATQRPDAKLLPGETKDQHVDTPVLTVRGEKRMQDVEVGDIVFNEHGTPSRVVNATEVMHNNACYELEFDTGDTIVCSGMHRWPAIITTSTGVDKDSSEHIRTEILYNYFTGGAEISVPLAQKIYLPHAEFNTDPYTLGSIVATQKDDLSTTIPDVYLYSSIQQRTALLSGIVDTCEHEHNKTNENSDNTVRNGYIVVSTAHKNFADNVYYLGLSLGIKARKVVHTVDNVSTWKVTLYTTREQLNAPEGEIEHKNREAKKDTAHRIVSIRPIGVAPTRCIEVDNSTHTYLSGNSLVPTHNSNLGCRINCGYTPSLVSSMILDDAEGTKVKPNPKGRFYIKIYSKGNHGQAFWAKEDWMDKYLDSQGLNADGTPKGSTQKASAIDSMEKQSGVSLEMSEVEGGQHSRPEDDWDLDDLIAENEE